MHLEYYIYLGSGEGESNSGIIIGAAVGGFLLIILIIIFLFNMKKWKGMFIIYTPFQFL